MTGERGSVRWLPLAVLALVAATAWWLAGGPTSDGGGEVPAPRPPVVRDATPPAGDAPAAGAPDADASLPVLAHDPAAVELAEPPGATVPMTGRVVDEAGAPVAGARVHLFDVRPPQPADLGYGEPRAASWTETLDDWWRPDLGLDDVRPPRRVDLGADDLDARFVTTTDQDGGYALEAPVPEDVRAPPMILVTHPEFAPGVLSLWERFLEAGTHDDLVLVPGLTVRGRAVDTSGRPVADAVVRLGNEQVALAHVLRTGPTGDFAFEHVRPARYELRIEHPGHVTTLRGHLEWKEDTDLGDVTLASGHAMEGRVLGPDGLPVERAHVFVTTQPIRSRSVHPSTDDFRPDDDSILLELEVDRMPSTGHAVTDADGRFRIAGRRRANHTLYARHPAHEPARVRDVLPDDTLEVRLGVRRDLRVRVTGPEGAPVDDVDLRAWRLLGSGGGRRVPVAVVDAAAGLHRVEGLGTRGTHLQVTAPGHAFVTRTYPPEELAGRELVELSLAAGYAIEAEVVDEQGELVEHWNVWISEPAPEGAITVRSPDAEDTGPRHRFEGVPAGTYEVHASADFFARYIAPEPKLVSVGPDTPVATCTLVARVGATLTGTVSSPDAEPLWSSVELARPGDTPTRDSPGARRSRYVKDRYTIQNVEPGSWVVWFDGREAGTVELAAGETTTFDLAAPARPRLVGVVTAGGAPVPGAGVRATAPRAFGSARESGTTDANGRYELPLDQAGTWTVGAVEPDAAGYRTPWDTAEVDVPEHGVATRDLTLPVGRLRVRVVDHEGEPVAGRRLWWSRDPEGGMGPRTTDADGEVVFGFVPPGRWRPTVHREHDSPAAKGAWIEVPADDRLVVAPELVVPRGFALSGRAFVAPGVPAPRGSAVRVWDVDADAYIQSARLAGSRFRFEGLVPGTYRVAFFRDDGRRFDDDNGRLGTEVTITDAEVELELVGAVDEP